MMKILAVDDDEIALALLGEMLTGAGYTHNRLCSSAAEAFDLILKEKPAFDCFLFDIRMPGMDGIDLCKEVRAMPTYKRTPIIMVTAMSEKSFIDRAFAAGASDYVTKPIEPLDVSVRLGLAEEIISERKFLNESTDVIESLIQELDRVTRHDLDEPIEILNIDNVLSYPAFENYLFQLSRGVFFLTSLFAVKIRDVDVIHSKLAPLEFKDFLTRAAAAVMLRLRGQDVFLAYRGNGVFVGAMPRRGIPSLKHNNGSIKLNISTADDDMIPGMPDHTVLVFGEPVVSRIFRKPGTLQHMCAAIENVEARIARSERHEDYPDVIIPRIRSEETERQRLREDRELRQEYESLLRDALSEDLTPATPWNTPQQRSS